MSLGRQRRRKPRILRFETLETRWLLAVVNSVGAESDWDPGDGICETAKDNGICTLVAAIEETNSLPGRDTITFSVDQILTGQLPEITGEIIVDGNARSVEIMGDPGLQFSGGLRISGPNCQVIGMVMLTLELLPGADGCLLEGNFVGEVDVASSGTRIVGRSADSRNVFGTLRLNEGADHTVVAGNFVGVDEFGTEAVGAGLQIESSHNTIGGMSGEAANVIGGTGGTFSSAYALGIRGNDNHVLGNYIGITVAGDAALSGMERTPGGILILGSNNTIGGDSPAEGNVISGFQGSSVSSGVVIGGTSAAFFVDKPVNNLIQNNYIGTAPTGMTATPNSIGIFVHNAEGPEGNLIKGNVVSGNADVGIAIKWSNSTYIQGNLIGLAKDGTTLLGNGRTGVYVLQNSTQTVIGGAAAGERNIISGNGEYGVRIGPLGADHAEVNFVLGNYIGTDASGTLARGNALGGIQVESPKNQIGRPEKGAGNLISGNGGAGINILGTNNTFVRGNRIGTDHTGQLALGNDSVGIGLFDEARDNFIGGAETGAANVIAFNSAGGVLIESSAGIGNKVRQNSIFANGPDSSQRALGIDLGSSGVTPNDFDDSDVGPNKLVNFPVLSIDQAGRISGSLSAEPGNYTIELFANSKCDASGHGEGERFLTSFDLVVPASSGRKDFQNVFVAPSESNVTATATTSINGTSEFSACEQAPFVDSAPVFLSGNKSEDLNANGTRSGDEPGLDNWPILLDIDSDGTQDGITFTNSDGDYVFPGLAVGRNQNLTHDLPFYFSEGSVAINPRNPLNIVAFSNWVGDGLFKAVTHDGGISWARSIIFSKGVDSACCDPSAAFDKFGNLFLAFLQTDNSRSIVVAASIDGGNTFSTIERLDARAQVDQPSIATGDDSVWVVYRDGENRMSVAGTRIHGYKNFDLPFIRKRGLFPQIIGSEDGNYGEIAIGPAGQILVAYQTPSGGEGPATIKVHLDFDGLGQFGFGLNRLLPQLETNVGGFDFIPAQSERAVDAGVGIAYDRSNGPYRGRAYLLYTDEIVIESNDLDVFLMYSDDDGATWSDRVRVNDDNTPNSQFFPRIAVDQTSGLVAISWYDARLDEGNGGPGDTNGIPNDEVQYWATVSFDGGNSFVPNVRVSEGTTSAAAAANPNDLGDYSGLAFDNYTLYPLWSDNSNSTGDNPLGKYSSLGLYTSKVKIIPAGTHTVSEVLQDGYKQTMPVQPGTRQVLALPLIGASNLDFGNFKLGTIQGTKFLDQNNNGVREGGEPGLSNWSIFLNPIDSDGDGNFDGGLMEAVTDANGEYRFEGLEAGDYTVGERQLPGFRQSLPDPSPTRTITVQGLSSGEVYTGFDFGNAPTMSVIRGVKYEDVNGNGNRDSGEPGLAGWTVFLESQGGSDGILNNPVRGDGVCDETASEPCAITDELGFYTIAALPFGNYAVREVAQAGWTLTSDLSELVFADGLAAVFPGPDIGNFQLGVFNGRVFNDFNGRGYGGPPKKGLSDVAVFLDLNDDGILNHPVADGQCDMSADEPCLLSDEYGFFTFTGLSLGTYNVRVAVPAGYRQTIPRPQAGYDMTLDSSSAVIKRFEFGLHDPPPEADLVSPSAGSTVDVDMGYLDVRWTDPSGAAGGVDVSTIDASDLIIENDGDVLTIDRVEDLGNGVFRYIYNEDGDVLRNGEVRVTFKYGEVADVNFSYSNKEIEQFTFTFVHGGIHGYKFADRNNNGLDDQEPRLGGVAIRLDIDEDRNGVFERFVTTTTDAATGAFAFVNLKGGRYLVTEVDPTNQTTVSPEVITLASGEVYVAESGQVTLGGNQSEVVQPKLAFGNRNTRPWMNSLNPFDVNGMDGVSPLDVLILINYIIPRGGSSALPAAPAEPPPYYDVNGDNFCTPIDVLNVINFLNARQIAGEGQIELSQFDPTSLQANFLDSVFRGESRNDWPIQASRTVKITVVSGAVETNSNRLPYSGSGRLGARQSLGSVKPTAGVMEEALLTLEDILNEIAAHLSLSQFDGNRKRDILLFPVGK